MKLPALTNGAPFFLNWKLAPGATPPTALSATDVWTKYVGVWHMDVVDGEGGCKMVRDSSANGLDATNGTAAASLTTAKVGGACEQTENNKALRTTAYQLTAGTLPQRLADEKYMTVSGWMQLNVDGEQNASLFAKGTWNTDTKKSVGWYQNTQNNVTTMTMLGDGAASSSTWLSCDFEKKLGFNLYQHWIHFVCVYNGATHTMYANGQKLGSSSGRKLPKDEDHYALNFGNRKGYLDEMRIYNGAMPAAWAVAEYATQTDDAFLTAAVDPRPVISVGNELDVSRHGFIALPVTLVWKGWDATVATVTVRYQKAGGAWQEVQATLQDGENLVELPDAEQSTTYQFSVTAVSDRGDKSEAVVRELASPDVYPFRPDLYAKHAKLRAAGYAGEETLADFPVAVRLKRGFLPLFDPADCGTAGEDIRFSDAAGNLYAHEVDTWNADGESIVWVKVPALAKGTDFYLHWQKARPQDVIAPVDSTDVWTKYVGVWHMNVTVGPNGGSLVADSSANGFDATNGTAAVSALTKVGGACELTNNVSLKTGITNLTAKTLARPIDNQQRMSMSGWMRLKNNSEQTAQFFCKGSWNDGTPYGWYQNTQNSVTKMSMLGAGKNYCTSTCSSLYKDWVHFVFVYDGTTFTMYANGQQIDRETGRNAATDDSRRALTIGSHQGYLDEMRIYNGVVSADWAQAEYAAQNEKDFVLGLVASEGAFDPDDLDVQKGFDRHLRMTVAGYTNETTLADFPVLVRLSRANIPGFTYTGCGANGCDIRFTDANGRLCAHEVDTWNTSGESCVWVRLPSLSGQTTTVDMHWRPRQGRVPPATSRPARSPTSFRRTSSRSARRAIATGTRPTDARTGRSRWARAPTRSRSASPSTAP